MLLNEHTSIPAWIFINLTAGLGIGILFPALTYGVQASSTDADMAYAVTLLVFLRNLGQTIGVAIGGSVFQNQLAKQLKRYESLAPLAEQYAKDASGLVQVIKALPAGPTKTDLIHSYSEALKYVWLVSCVFAGVSFLLGLASKEYSIDRELVTEQGFKHEQKERDQEKEQEQEEQEKA